MKIKYQIKESFLYIINNISMISYFFISWYLKYVVYKTGKSLIELDHFLLEIIFILLITDSLNVKTDNTHYEIIKLLMFLSFF